MLQTLCEQFLFSNKVTFKWRTHFPDSLDTLIAYKNVENEMVLAMRFKGVIPKISTDSADLIPYMKLITEIHMFKEVTEQCINIPEWGEYIYNKFIKLN